LVQYLGGQNNPISSLGHKLYDHTDDNEADRNFNSKHTLPQNLSCIRFLCLWQIFWCWLHLNSTQTNQDSRQNKYIYTPSQQYKLKCNIMAKFGIFLFPWLFHFLERRWENTRT